MLLENMLPYLFLMQLLLFHLYTIKNNHFIENYKNSHVPKGMFSLVVPYWHILFNVLLMVWILINGTKPLSFSVSLAWPYPGLSDVPHREKFSGCGNYSLCPPGRHGFQWLLGPFCQNVSLLLCFFRVDDGKVTGIDKEAGGITCPGSVLQAKNKVEAFSPNAYSCQVRVFGIAKA